MKPAILIWRQTQSTTTRVERTHGILLQPWHLHETIPELHGQQLSEEAFLISLSLFLSLPPLLTSSSPDLLAANRFIIELSGCVCSHTHTQTSTQYDVGMCRPLHLQDVRIIPKHAGLSLMDCASRTYRATCYALASHEVCPAPGHSKTEHQSPAPVGR